VSWATVERAVQPDGSVRAIKRTSYDARLEACGLQLLEDAGAPVPKRHVVAADRIVMDWVEGPADWELLGKSLARVHRSTSPLFGLDYDNLIGSLAQPNAPQAGWGPFFADNRVRVHIEDPAIPSELALRLRMACDGPLQALLDEHRPTPSLIHGDLWAGNIVGGRWLIDPSVSYADREMELAFMTMFSGIPRSMMAAYLEELPLADGWERRRPALRLHHILVHVRLFGASYLGQLASTLDRLGW
jgi:fructosamine-3-kinase